MASDRQKPRKKVDLVGFHPYDLVDTCTTTPHTKVLSTIWHARIRRHDRKVRFGLVNLSGLEIHSAERGTQLAVGAVRRGR